MCMVHKVAQEASRRTTPARALTHAVAPPLDRTSHGAIETLETAASRAVSEHGQKALAKAPLQVINSTGVINTHGQRRSLVPRLPPSLPAIGYES